MSKSNEGAANTVNTSEAFTFKVREMDRIKGAYRIIEVKPEELTAEMKLKLPTSDTLTPEQFIAGLHKNNKASLVNKEIVYAPGVDWYERAKQKKEHIPTAVILSWLEQGNELVWGRTKFWGKKPQLQTPDALKSSHKNSNANELTMDDFEF